MQRQVQMAMNELGKSSERGTEKMAIRRCILIFVEGRGCRPVLDGNYVCLVATTANKND